MALKQLTQLGLGSTHRKMAPQGRSPILCRAALTDLIPVALFFTPGICALIYAYFKGKGNLKDGLSRSDEGWGAWGEHQPPLSDHGTSLASPLIPQAAD